MKHVKIVITGKVQGVYFRETAVRRARKLRVSGFVRNEPDGTVYIEAEGEDQAVDALVGWSREGPRQATVESVNLSEHSVVGHSGFQRV